MKTRPELLAAIDRLADRIENGHLLASMGGEDLLVAASEKIAENESLRIQLGEIEEIAEDAVKCAMEQQQVIAVARRELERARAAIQWFAEVRSVVAGDGDAGCSSILIVAHALSEVWLSGEPVTARAVADLLGWYTLTSAPAVCEWLRPLQTGPCPPLVFEDLRPNIEVDE